LKKKNTGKPVGSNLGGVNRNPLIREKENKNGAKGRVQRKKS